MSLLLSRRLVLSCSSLTSLLRFSVAMEPPKTVNAFSGGFAVSPNLDHELSPIFVWLSCCEDFAAHVFVVSIHLFLRKACVFLTTHDHDCQYCHCMEFVPTCHRFINRTPLIFIFVDTYQFFQLITEWLHFFNEENRCCCIMHVSEFFLWSLRLAIGYLIFPPSFISLFFFENYTVQHRRPLTHMNTRTQILLL